MKLFRKKGIDCDAFVKALKKDILATWKAVKEDKLMNDRNPLGYKEGYIDGLAYCIGAINQYSEEFKEGTNG